LLKWYKEPFLHFILLGTVLFFIIKWNGSENIEEKRNVIVVKQEDADRAKYIEDEILYREALERNLDKDDYIIRKLLIDKLKYTMSDSVNIAELSNEVLEKYFNANKSKFTKESQITLTFGQIYLNPQNHEDIDNVAKKLLNEVSDLSYNKSISTKGDKFYAGSYFNHLTKAELSKSFSRSFVSDLVTLPIKKWSLLKSGFGVHLIYIVDIKKREPKFEDVKDKVKNSYIIEKNRNAYKEFYQKIKDKYNIIIDSNSSNNG